ncbi:MAG: phosphoribosylformylglycinamidine synthase subunit PurQ [Oligoflexales bacterium]
MPTIGSVKKKKIGIIQFPGSNCDTDCYRSLDRHFNAAPVYVWHKEHTLPPLDGVILPGGFSYGDYLRSGALASWSPIVNAVKEYAKKGGPVLGICNGFQVLTESRMLPGALLKNSNGQFVCDNHIYLKTDAGGDSAYHNGLSKKVLRVPIAHGDGRYHIDGEGLKKLKGQGQILFRYSDSKGVIGGESNPNGAVDDVAGVISENGKVLGMMPHPERATDVFLGGSSDGLGILEIFLNLSQ